MQVEIDVGQAIGIMGAKTYFTGLNLMLCLCDAYFCKVPKFNDSYFFCFMFSYLKIDGILFKFFVIHCQCDQCYRLIINKFSYNQPWKMLMIS